MYKAYTAILLRLFRDYALLVSGKEILHWLQLNDVLLAANQP